MKAIKWWARIGKQPPINATVRVSKAYKRKEIMRLCVLHVIEPTKNVCLPKACQFHCKLQAGSWWSGWDVEAPTHWHIGRRGCVGNPARVSALYLPTASRRHPVQVRVDWVDSPYYRSPAKTRTHYKRTWTCVNLLNKLITIHFQNTALVVNTFHDRIACTSNKTQVGIYWFVIYYIADLKTYMTHFSSN